jgi:general secretion pathway protein G
MRSASPHISASRTGSRGFTLIEVVVVLSILAVLAGAMIPAVVQQVERARTRATQQEMADLVVGLHAYYEDCGTLPSSLFGLVTDADGDPGWDGPYMGGLGDVATGVAADAWGSAYTYVVAPTLSGGGRADLVLISAGQDRALGSSQSGGTWTLDADGDLIHHGSLAATDDGWRKEARSEVQVIADALERYYEDVGAFPSGTDSTAIAALVSSGASGWSGPYLSGSLTQLARDPWGNRYWVRSCTAVNGESMTGRLVLSRGPGTPDASATGSSYTTAANDIHRVVGEDALQARRNAMLLVDVRHELRLLAGQIYTANPSVSPASSALGEVDPWGHAYQYRQQTTYSGFVYSYGSDGVDDTGGNDDAREAMVWTP